MQTIENAWTLSKITQVKWNTNLIPLFDHESRRNIRQVLYSLQTDQGILKNYKRQFEIISTRLGNLLAQHQKQLYLINKSRRFRAIWRQDESYETYSHLSG